MRIRHLGIVVQDLEQTAEFYENVLGFKRLGEARTPGHYPGKALDLSDGEVNYSLLQPNPDIQRSEWTYGEMVPNHIGVTTEDTGAVVTALKERGIEVYGAEQWFGVEAAFALLAFVMLTTAGAGALSARSGAQSPGT